MNPGTCRTADTHVASAGRPDGRWPLFLAASLLLHLGLLANWSPSLFRIGSTEQREMAVILQPPPPPARTARIPAKTPPHPHTAKPSSARRTAKAKPPVPARHIVDSRPAPEADHHPQPVQKTAAASTEATESTAKQLPPAKPAATVQRAPTEQERAALRRRLAARIGAELARYFEYPLMARRRGWQGTVILGFRVTALGRIEAIRVTHGSGHALLDRSAVGALGKVRQLPPEAMVASQSLNLQLPVIYRLEAP